MEGVCCTIGQRATESSWQTPKEKNSTNADARITTDACDGAHAPIARYRAVVRATDVYRPWTPQWLQPPHSRTQSVGSPSCRSSMPAQPSGSSSSVQPAAVPVDDMDDQRAGTRTVHGRGFPRHALDARARVRPSFAAIRSGCTTSPSGTDATGYSGAAVRSQGGGGLTQPSGPSSSRIRGVPRSPGAATWLPTVGRLRRAARPVRVCGSNPCTGYGVVLPCSAIIGEIDLTTTRPATSTPSL